MADEEFANEPTLIEQTIALGRLLNGYSERDPSGTPSPSAEAAFRAWLLASGPTSRQPRYFADVIENYEVRENSNEDLFRMFDLLHPYIQAPEDEEEEPPGTFIGLPMAP